MFVLYKKLFDILLFDNFYKSKMFFTKINFNIFFKGK